MMIIFPFRFCSVALLSLLGSGSWAGDFSSIETISSDAKKGMIEGWGYGPKGERRVLHSSRVHDEGALHLYSTDIDTGESVDLVGDLGWCFPEWKTFSPDKKHLAFECEENQYVSDLVTRKRASVGSMDVSEKSRLEPSKWTPSGKLIVFKTKRDGTSKETLTIYAATAHGKIVWTSKPIPVKYDSNRVPLTSALLVTDDDIILDTGNDPDTNLRDVVALSMRDGSVRPLAKMARKRSKLRISPDGKWLVWTAPNKGNTVNTISSVSLEDPSQRYSQSLGSLHEFSYGKNNFSTDGRFVFVELGYEQGVDGKVDSLSGFGIFEFAKGNLQLVTPAQGLKFTTEFAVTGPWLYFAEQKVNKEGTQPEGPLNVFRRNYAANSQEKVFSMELKGEELLNLFAKEDKAYFVVAGPSQYPGPNNREVKLHSVDLKVSRDPVYLRSFIGYSDAHTVYYPDFDLLTVRGMKTDLQSTQLGHVFNPQTKEVFSTCDGVREILSLHEVLISECKPGVYLGRF